MIAIFIAYILYKKHTNWLKVSYKNAKNYLNYNSGFYICTDTIEVLLRRSSILKYIIYANKFHIVASNHSHPVNTEIHKTVLKRHFDDLNSSITYKVIRVVLCDYTIATLQTYLRFLICLNSSKPLAAENRKTTARMRRTWNFDMLLLFDVTGVTATVSNSCFYSQLLQLLSAFGGGPRETDDLYYI